MNRRAYRRMVAIEIAGAVLVFVTIFAAWPALKLIAAISGTN